MADDRDHEPSPRTTRPDTEALDRLRRILRKGRALLAESKRVLRRVEEQIRREGHD